MNRGPGAFRAWKNPRLNPWGTEVDIRTGQFQPRQGWWGPTESLKDLPSDWRSGTNGLGWPGARSERKRLASWSWIVAAGTWSRVFMELRSISCLLIVDDKKEKVLLPWAPGINEITNYKALLILFSVSKVGLIVALSLDCRKKQTEGMYGNHQAQVASAMVPCHRGCGESEISSNSHTVCISSAGSGPSRVARCDQHCIEEDSWHPHSSICLGWTHDITPSALSSPTLRGLTLPWLLASFLWPFFSLPIEIQLFSLGVLSLSVLRTFLLCFSALIKRSGQWDGTQEVRSKISEWEGSFQGAWQNADCNFLFCALKAQLC